MSVFESALKHLDMLLAEPWAVIIILCFTFVGFLSLFKVKDDKGDRQITALSKIIFYGLALFAFMFRSKMRQWPSKAENSNEADKNKAKGRLRKK